MAQKEIEQDQEKFRDKESFVTSAYKEKLAERKVLEEELAREAALEGKVTSIIVSSLLECNYCRGKRCYKTEGPQPISKTFIQPSCFSKCIHGE